MAHATALIGETPWRTAIATGGGDLVADEPEALGGAGAGFAPYDLLLASLAACTAITLRMYAARKRWTGGAIKVDLALKGGKEDMHIARTLTLEGFDEEQKSRLADIAERTPVTLTLKNGLPIETRLA